MKDEIFHKDSHIQIDTLNSSLLFSLHYTSFVRSHFSFCFWKPFVFSDAG